ncbi:MAG: EAL domain-containing protein [Halanaerobiales bacterium]
MFFNHSNVFKQSSFILLLILLLLLVTGNTYAGGQPMTTNHFRVLVFHSYQESLLWDRHINIGVQEVFARSGLDYDLYYEYMDSKREKTGQYFLELADFYRFKYKEEDFDLVIASDNNALAFLKQYGRELFPSVPVIFTGVNGFEEYMISSHPHITGVAEDLSFRETIDIALQNHPEKENIIIYGDNTTTYRVNKQQLLNIIPEYENRINFDFRDDLRISEIVEDLETEGNDSIVLLISTITDDQGRTLSFVRISELLSEANPSIPIYGLWDFFVGHGAVGGKVVSGKVMGSLAAEMAVDYLNGIPVEDLEVIQDSPNIYMFDYNKLNQFEIQEDTLPEDSIIVNSPDPIWHINREYVISALIVLVILISFIIYLIHSRNKIKKAREELEAEREFSDRIVNTAEAAIVVLDLEGRVKLFNRFAEEISHYSREEVIGKDAYQLFFTESAKLYYREKLKNKLENDISQWRTDTTVIDKRGEKHLVSWHNSVIRNTDHEINGILSIGIDLTEQNRIEESLQYKLYHDELTSLPNMKFIREKLTISLEEAIEQDENLAIMMLDLDKFRLINDIYGHQFGDQLLIRVSERINSSLDPRVTLARIGGDDYIILISDINEVPEVISIAEEILEEIRKPYFIDDEEIMIQASIGIAVYPGDGSNEDLLIKAADSALYRAKEIGKGSYQLYNNDINIRNTERLFLEKNMTRALEEEQFEVYFQPIVNVSDSYIIGAEALLRWNHPERGFIPPGKFIPIAEENGLIIEIGYYVIRQACSRFKKWTEQGCDPGILTVNLSPRQFNQDNLIENIEEILDECQFPGDRLALEITESTAISNPGLTSRTLYEMRNKGIGVFLDDFGTGFSSLNYLTRFPVNGLKIDRSFINLLEKGGENQSIVAAIIAMAHELGIRVVAEGVETNEQLDFIRQHKCDYTQGYYCYHPMPADKLEELLLRRDMC